MPRREYRPKSHEDLFPFSIYKKTEDGTYHSIACFHDLWRANRVFQWLRPEDLGVREILLAERREEKSNFECYHEKKENL